MQCSTLKIPSNEERGYNVSTTSQLQQLRFGSAFNKKGTCQICRKDSAVKMLLYHIAHSHRRHTGHVEFILTSQACRLWRCRGCHFGKSVNPISTKGGSLCPLNNTGTPGFSDLPTALCAFLEYFSHQHANSNDTCCYSMANLHTWFHEFQN